MFQKPSSDIALSMQDDSLQDEVETVVGPSVHVEGDFASAGNILVKGMVSGNVKTSRLLTVEGGAVINANVKAGDAIISGEIKGNVKVGGTLELTSTAKIVGDISCETLAIEPGALLYGKVAMKGLEESAGKRKSRRRKTKDTAEESGSAVSDAIAGDGEML